MDIRLYKLADGRLWSVESGRFIEIAPESSELIMLYADGRPAGEDYLIRTLRFYGYVTPHKPRRTVVFRNSNFPEFLVHKN